MKLYMSDLYRTEFIYPLDEVSQDILYYLYQPIIGTAALQLYMMLSIESKRMSKDLKPSPLTRLTSFLTMSLLDIEKKLEVLEAVGLLKTYVRHHQELTFYVYQLQNPLSLQKFFKNQILVSLLQEALSDDDYRLTLKYFEATITNLEGFEDITSSFQDVFDIKYCKNGVKKQLMPVFKEKKQEDIVVNYDFELLNRCLADYQVNRGLLKDDDFRYVTQLAIVYSIDARTLAGFIKDAMKSTGLDRQLLKNNMKQYFEIDNASQLKEVYHKQPLQYKTANQQQSPLVLHMKYLDSITPYELLKEKQGGKEPVFSDLKIVETLMVQLGLQPAVVNVLVEYVLGKNNNRLSKNYCESIAASWTRKKIETAMEAYYELMGRDEEDASINVEKSEEVENHTEETQQNPDELMNLLQQLQEGQL